MFLTQESTENKEFEPHPKGIAKGVCVQVITINKKTGQPFTKLTQEGEVKNRLILVFQTEKTQVNDKGEEFHCVYWDWHNIPKTLSYEAGSLHKRLKEWGVPIRDFETEEDFANAVVNRPATLVFTHNVSEKTGKLYSNIASCIPLEEGEPSFIETRYERYGD